MNCTFTMHTSYKNPVINKNVKKLMLTGVVIKTYFIKFKFIEIIWIGLCLLSLIQNGSKYRKYINIFFEDLKWKILHKPQKLMRKHINLRKHHTLRHL